MIKPEDVPKEFVYKVVEKARRSKIDAELGKSTSNEQEIADLLNAAIESGLVSPPVYTVRDKNGYLLDDEVYGLWSNPDLAEGRHGDGYSAEHWKGQTE